MRFLSASPEDINRVGRRGEARVYEMLSQAFGDSDRWYALYGQVVYQLTQAHNLGRRQPVDPDIRPKRELDFIVFDRERGFLVIEVKGGAVRLEFKYLGGVAGAAPIRQRPLSFQRILVRQPLPMSNS